MHSSKIFALLSVAICMAGCASTQQKPTQSAPHEAHAFKPMAFEYDAESSPAANFSRQLDIPIFQCDLEAVTGSYAVRYSDQQGTAEYSQALMDCKKYANAEGNVAIARLKAAGVSARQAELAKDLYAKWTAYLSTMSPYRRPDLRAKSEYVTAKEALETEVKFAK
ncbi:hypothetical protein [Pseudomonas syringae]|uniref:hypothetical protein n=1 Tax=Pseudomonas syringae TaxID=317 RepID=UPI00165E3CFC|nr:hypothetical protein [Pseudomonas syringae]QNR43479.1 hypothetical protein D5S12_20085 [Pseudomonas syringae]